MRKERYGGIIFNRESGASLEVNPSAFDLLTRFDGTRGTDAVIGSYLNARGIPDRRIREALLSFTHYLRFRRILTERGRSAPIRGREIRATPRDISHVKLSAPEVLHLSLTDACDLGCPICYLTKAETSPIGIESIHDVLTQCEGLGVLQLAIGGGEPLTRLPELMEAIRIASRFMRVSVTTNGHLLDRETCEGLGDAGLHHLQVSINGPAEVHDEVTGVRDYSARMAGIRTAIETGLFTGVNCLLSPSLLPVLPWFVASLEGEGVRNVNVIRPKRSARNREWYAEHALGTEHLRDLRATLTRAVHEHPGMALTHDCSLVQMYREEDPGKLRSLGIHGCTAGTRICHVTPGLDVYGCSHQVGEEEPAGNLGDRSLLEVWDGMGRRSVPHPPCCDCSINHICIPCVHIPEEEVAFCES